MSRILVGATLLVVLLALPPDAMAQARGRAGDDEHERAFVEALRRDDPGAAERYVALRDTREHAVTEVQRVEARYNAAGRELRPVFLAELRRARRTYAQSSLALLDFLEARDRQALASYEEAITRINRLLEEHTRMRAELEKLLRDE